MEKPSKEYIYHENAFNLFLVKHLDRIRVAGYLAAKAIKAGFKFAYAYPFERRDRDNAYNEFCNVLQEQLKKGLDK